MTQNPSASCQSAPKRKISFISTMGSSAWGGSEELWSKAALCLVRGGHAVTANVVGWPQRPAALAELLREGVEIHERWTSSDRIRPEILRLLLRPGWNPLYRLAFPRFFSRWLGRQRLDFVCISSGWIGDEQGVMRLCLQSGIPYGVLVQANAEQWWPDDLDARQLADIYCGARRVFFVSERNRSLLEAQLGIELPNAEVVRNPYNVRRDAAPPWPSDGQVLRLACIGRLDPEAKGQDLILQVLATEPWRSRPVSLSIYGSGRCEEGMRRLVRRLGLAERVQFCGQDNDIERIWATHHALVMSSRFEGLPLVIVEAMICGRPAIVTDVAGNAELVQDGVSGFVAEAPTVRHLSAALERAWEERHRWEEIGRIAAVEIRKLVPADPAADFAQRLLEFAKGSQPAPQRDMAGA